MHACWTSSNCTLMWALCIFLKNRIVVQCLKMSILLWVVDWSNLDNVVLHQIAFAKSRSTHKCSCKSCEWQIALRICFEEERHDAHELLWGYCDFCDCKIGLFRICKMAKMPRNGRYFAFLNAKNGHAQCFIKHGCACSKTGFVNCQIRFDINDIIQQYTYGVYALIAVLNCHS